MTVGFSIHCLAIDQVTGFFLVPLVPHATSMLVWGLLFPPQCFIPSMGQTLYLGGLEPN